MSRRASLVLNLFWLAALGCSPATPPAPAPLVDMSAMPTPFVAPPINRPPVKSAADVNFPNDAAVVGVLVPGGRARAYLVEAIRPLSHHVVNDQIDNTPVTVTYFARNKTIRVFTDVDVGHPLDIKIGGFNNGMLLMVGSNYFEQATGRSLTPELKFPYDTMPHELTTWGAWIKSHAESEIYVGDLSADDIRRP